MSGRFVRASKYRHVFGRPTRKEQCYDNIRISKNAWDTNLIKANPSYLSVNWEASGGGAFAVIPLAEKGKAPEAIPLFRGHTAVVLDTDWHPFDDQIIASGSDDGKAFIWRVPDNFSISSSNDEIRDISPVAKLSGHSRKVGHVLFNPSAADVLATSSGDFTIKIWDIEAAAAKLTLKHADIVQSLSWSANGGLMVTTSRDKKLRIWDVRQEQPVHVGAGHAGAKNSRAVWMGEHDRIATTGFSRMSDRQLGLWDIRNADTPMGGFESLDSISGVCMPFWDDSTQCLYLAGKGDGNIRYFEYENDKFEFLSEYKSADPQRGLAFMPKRGLNLRENEVMRAFKTVNDNYIEPISFIVPRRSEMFQGDIYPPVTGVKPGMCATEYFDGRDTLPPKIDLESVYEGQEPVEVASDYKPSQPLTPMTPASIHAPSETKKADAGPRGGAADGATSREPPSIRQHTASMASVAAKYDDDADDDTPEDHDADDTSSFEEVTHTRNGPARGTSAVRSTSKAPSATDEDRFASPKAMRLLGRDPSGTNEMQKPRAPGGTTLPIEQSHLAELKLLLQSQQSLWEKQNSDRQSQHQTLAADLKPLLQAHQAILEKQGNQLALLEKQGKRLTELTFEVASLKMTLASLRSERGAERPHERAPEPDREG